MAAAPKAPLELEALRHDVVLHKRIAIAEFNKLIESLCAEVTA